MSDSLLTLNQKWVFSQKVYDSLKRNYGVKRKYWVIFSGSYCPEDPSWPKNL